MPSPTTTTSIRTPTRTRTTTSTRTPTSTRTTTRIRTPTSTRTTTSTRTRTHPHPHDHPHPHEHPHPQDPAEAGAPSRRGLIAIGLAGGLLPSPSALLVLLGAVAVGHAWFGVALVVAFGLGMAATLAVVGLLVMRLRERAELRLRSHPASRLAPMLRIAPAATAVVVVVLGAALAWRGLGATGLL